MATSSMHPRELPVTEEEEPDALPPAYEESELPSYERSSISIPTINLQFRQMSRKLMSLDSTDEDGHVHYKIAGRGGPRLFSDKPGTVLTLENDGKSICIGGMDFDDSTVLPWMPRGNVMVDVAGSGSRKVHMQSANFADWTFKSNDGERDVRLKWTLQDRPTSLALLDVSSGFCIARFHYSVYGTTANKGLPVGDLAIYNAGAYGLTAEIIICGCYLVVKYWAKMGRHHRCHSSTSGRYSYGSGVTLNGAYSTLAYT